ncbi:hypothetical protein BD410DRAFT_816457 [Rickenella mellea]|uniref:Cyclin-like domain-containing protein n=1 Tax=Rickenella mellea TaxID=50990 RepID=A0A4Y7PQH8_9AGAM|nr:hypothetical protein BD410DRAFT_816457 [Rickenella mellea]
MATDFWSSSHYKRWMVDRATAKHARAEDIHYADDPEHIALLGVFFYTLISKLATKLLLRQRVIATATVFFRRFYLKNSYCETDPYIVLAACCYVAAKAEESPVHIKNVVSEARSLFNEYNIKGFTTDNAKLAEMEFYLVDDLECDLIVFHPYRTLMTLVKEQGKDSVEREAGELGAGIEDGPRYWGTGQGCLILPSGAIQTAWFIINDTYRSDLCLLYPPHLIAITALYLTCIIQPHARKAHLEWAEFQQQAAAVAMSTAQSQSESQAGTPTRRSSRHSSTPSSKEKEKDSPAPTPTPSISTSDPSSVPQRNKTPGPPQDFVGFFAGLNVNMPLIASMAQEMLAFYVLCDRLKDDVTSNGAPKAGQGVSATASQGRARGQATRGQTQAQTQTPGQVQTQSATPGAARSTTATPGSSSECAGGMPEELSRPVGIGTGGDADNFEVTSTFLMAMLTKMRVMREADIAHPASGRPVAVNKMLERAQAAG